MIEFHCKNCGQKLSVQDQHSGKRVKCPKCGSVGVVPDNSDKIKFNCENCGQSISVPQIYAGKKGKCPKCKNVIVVPIPGATPSKSASMVSFTCSMCDEIVQVPETSIGKTIECPGCGGYIETSPESSQGKSDASADKDRHEEETEEYEESEGVNKRIIIGISAVAAVVVVGLIILATVLQSSKSRPAGRPDSMRAQQQVADTDLRPRPVTSDTPPIEPVVQESPSKPSSAGTSEKRIEELITRLGNENKNIRQSTAEELAKIGLPAVQPLIKALGDKNERVRQFAAIALGQIGDPNTIQPLINVLKDRYDSVRKSAAAALGKIGPLAIQALIKELGDENWNDRRLAAMALGVICDPQSIHSLIKALGDENVAVRSLAARSLGNIGDSRAVQPLIETLKDQNSNVRERTATALGNIGDSQAIQSLNEALGDEDERVRISALRALKKIEGKVASKKWSKAQEQGGKVKIKEEPSKDEAAESVKKMELVKVEEERVKTEDEKAVQTTTPTTTDVATQKKTEELIKQLGDENDSVRRDAAWNLGKIADSKTAQSIIREAVGPLIKNLADKNPAVRAYAASTLGKIGDLTALQPLINTLEDSDPNVRLFAAAALGVLGDPQAEQPLKNLLNDKDARVQKMAAKSLTQLKVAPQLVKTPKEQTTETKQAQSAVIPEDKELADMLKKGSIVSIHASKQTVGSVLTQIEKATGNQVRIADNEFGFGRDDERTLSKRISINLQEKPFWEAIDAVSAAVGIKCCFIKDGMLRLSTQESQFNKIKVVGTSTVVGAFQLYPGFDNFFNQAMIVIRPEPRIGKPQLRGYQAEITLPGGEQIRYKADSMFDTSNIQTGELTLRIDRHDLNLPNGVKKAQEVKIEARLAVASDFKAFTLPPLGELVPKPVRVGNGIIYVKKAEPDRSMFEVNLLAEGLTFELRDIVLVDEAGNRVKSSGGGGSKQENRQNVSLYFPRAKISGNSGKCQLVFNVPGRGEKTIGPLEDVIPKSTSAGASVIRITGANMTEQSNVGENGDFEVRVEFDGFPGSKDGVALVGTAGRPLVSNGWGGADNMWQFWFDAAQIRDQPESYRLRFQAPTKVTEYVLQASFDNVPLMKEE